MQSLDPNLLEIHPEELRITLFYKKVYISKHNYGQYTQAYVVEVNGKHTEIIRDAVFAVLRTSKILKKISIFQSSTVRFSSKNVQHRPIE